MKVKESYIQNANIAGLDACYVLCKRLSQQQECCTLTCIEVLSLVPLTKLSVEVVTLSHGSYIF